MSQVSYEGEWIARVNAATRKMVPVGARITNEAERDAVYGVLPGYLLFCFCEQYRQQYATHWQALDGFIPAQLRLIEKHHWLPEQAFAITAEDELLLLLHRDLLDLQLPRQVYDQLQGDFERLGVCFSHLKTAEVPRAS